MIRFLSHTTSFVEFSTLNDITMLFQQLDKLVFPIGSGWTWTQFFYPLAWENGFRFEREAVRFHQNFLAMIGPEAKSAPPIYSARKIFRAVRRFLLTTSGLDRPEMQLPVEAWIDALHYVKNKELTDRRSAVLDDEKWRIDT